MKNTITIPTLFDSQRAPVPTWPQQGNPLFECRKPLPLERAMAAPMKGIEIFDDDQEFAEPTATPAGVHNVHCIHYAPAQDTRFCPDCRFNGCCRAARRRGLAPCP